jgi:hypothetical protein
MRRHGWIFGSAAALALLSGCSFQSALDNMAPRERQAELVALGKSFCTDRKSVLKQLHPELVKSVRDAESVLPAECPVGAAKWQLASYSWNTNIADVKQQHEEAVVVGSGKGKWTTVSLRLYGENDAPKQVVQWHVVASSKPPAALTFIEQYDAGMRIMRIVGAIAGLLIVGLIYWLVRRHRAKRAAA